MVWLKSDAVCAEYFSADCIEIAPACQIIHGLQIFVCRNYGTCQKDVGVCQLSVGGGWLSRTEGDRPCTRWQGRQKRSVLRSAPVQGCASQRPLLAAISRLSCAPPVLSGARVKGNRHAVGMDREVDCQSSRSDGAVRVSRYPGLQQVQGRTGTRTSGSLQSCNRKPPLRGCIPGSYGRRPERDLDATPTAFPSSSPPCGASRINVWSLRSNAVRRARKRARTRSDPTER